MCTLMYFKSPAWTRSIECATPTHITNNRMPVPVSSKSVAIPEPHNYGYALVHVLAQQPTICIYLLLEIVRVLQMNVLLHRWSYIYIHACTQCVLPLTWGHRISPNLTDFPKPTSGSQHSTCNTRMVYCPYTMHI